MAVAGAIVAMFASVSAHRYGFEYWGIRTPHLIDTQARLLHWAVTGREAQASPLAASETAQSSKLVGRADAPPAPGYLSATGLRGDPSPAVSGNGVASSKKL